MSLLNVESYVFINVFYLVLFCIHVCVDDVIKKNLNEWEKFNLIEVEGHTKRNSTFIQDPCGKSIMLRTTQRRNQLTYFYLYVSPFGVGRDRMHEEINWN